jgi:hypothetical protein
VYSSSRNLSNFDPRSWTPIHGSPLKIESLTQSIFSAANLPGISCEIHAIVDVDKASIERDPFGQMAFAE